MECPNCGAIYAKVKARLNDIENGINLPKKRNVKNKNSVKMNSEGDINTSISPPPKLKKDKSNTNAFLKLFFVKSEKFIRKLSHVIKGTISGWNSRKTKKKQAIKNKSLPLIITRIYRGKQKDVLERFKIDSKRLAAKGYRPSTQNWAQGQWGCGSFVVALFLCFILIGIFIFIYMIIVKPDGALTVSYELSELAQKAQIKKNSSPTDKKCSQCAETIKIEAKICRFCRYTFD